MRFTLILLTIVFLLSCQSTVLSPPILGDGYVQLDGVDFIFCKDTLEINEQKVVQILNEDGRFLGMLGFSGDTIVPVLNYYFTLKLLDINQDGADDLRIYEFSNTPNQCQNYLFDSKNHNFRLVENYFLDIEQVVGTNLYHSYNRAGCADYNWESHLSKIVDFQLIPIGLIEGQGCDFKVEEFPQFIKIYKVEWKDEQEILHFLEELPFAENIPTIWDKWDFNEKYWRENHQRFTAIPKKLRQD